jgi:hypothetical protein
MIPELTQRALDAAHAVLIAAWDATRFYADVELAGFVGRLRRTAAAANEAAVRGCRRQAEPGGAAELALASALFGELASTVEAALRRGLDLGAASELLWHQKHAGEALAALLETVEEATARAA